MSVAWKLEAWKDLSWVGMNLGPPNAWRGSTGPTPTPGRSGLGGDDVPRRNPNRGWDRREWERLKKRPDDELTVTLQRAYAELTSEDAPVSVLARVDAIVRPIAKPLKRGDIPLQIDWKALAVGYERANALYKLWQEESALRADAEDLEDLEIFLQ